MILKKKNETDLKYTEDKFWTFLKWRVKKKKILERERGGDGEE